MQNNYIEGIDSIKLSVKNFEQSCRFLTDLGLFHEYNTFKTLNGSFIELIGSNSCSLDQITFGTVHDQETVSHTDPNGIEIKIQPSIKKKVSAKAAETNGWDSINRVDQAVPVYSNAHPIEIGHIVISTPKFDETENFYKDLGFIESDRLQGRGVFLRCQKESGHHDIFLINAEQFALHHIAFTTRDIYELFAGGIHMDQKGWNTEIGPGRHPISSSFFWYFKSPLGSMIEYTCNEDFLTSAWKPRTVEYSPNITTEWAIEGGIDHKTKRQRK